MNGGFIFLVGYLLGAGTLWVAAELARWVARRSSDRRDDEFKSGRWRL